MTPAREKAIRNRIARKGPCKNPSDVIQKAVKDTAAWRAEIKLRASKI